MYIQMSFETSRFHLHKFERRINKNVSIGDDVATWLGEHLKVADCDCYGWRRSGDDGWKVDVRCEGQKYSIGIKAVPVNLRGTGSAVVTPEKSRDDDRAEWNMVIAKRRSFIERLFFLNRLKCDDSLCRRIFKILKRQFDFENVHKKRLRETF